MEARFSPDLLRRVQLHLAEMLEDRGYNAQGLRELAEMDEATFQEMLSPTNEEALAKLYLTVPHRTLPSESVAIVYCMLSRLGTGLKGPIAFLEENPTTQHVIIVSEHYNRLQHGKMMDLGQAYGRIEVFELSELLVNPTKYHLVPRHELVPEEHREALLAQLRVTEAQLPRIAQSDPIARWMGLLPGQIVRIHRKSQVAGDYLMYRICY